MLYITLIDTNTVIPGQAVFRSSAAVNKGVLLVGVTPAVNFVRVNGVTLLHRSTGRKRGLSTVPVIISAAVVPAHSDLLRWQSHHSFPMIHSRRLRLPPAIEILSGGRLRRLANQAHVGSRMTGPGPADIQRGKATLSPPAPAALGVMVSAGEARSSGAGEGHGHGLVSTAAHGTRARLRVNEKVGGLLTGQTPIGDNRTISPRDTFAARARFLSGPRPCPTRRCRRVSR